MLQNKVVVKFKDGSVSKGKTSDFFPNKPQFHLEDTDGIIKEITLENLKAIFFVKSFVGDKDRKDNYVDEVKAGGRKIKVSFIDGETVIGYTLGYAPDRQGFYLSPADLKSNNERIFVVNSATDNVTFL